MELRCKLLCRGGGGGGVCVIYYLLLQNLFARKFGRRIINFYLLARKGSKLLCLQEQQKGEYIIIFLSSSFQGKTSVVLPAFTSRSSKLSRKRFLVAFVILSHKNRLQGNLEESFCLIA